MGQGRETGKQGNGVTGKQGKGKGKGKGKGDREKSSQGKGGGEGRRGTARQGKARQGKGRQGKARKGKMSFLSENIYCFLILLQLNSAHNKVHLMKSFHVLFETIQDTLTSLERKNHELDICMVNYKVEENCG